MDRNLPDLLPLLLEGTIRIVHIHVSIENFRATLIMGIIKIQKRAAVCPSESSINPLEEDVDCEGRSLCEFLTRAAHVWHSCNGLSCTGRGSKPVEQIAGRRGGRAPQGSSLLSENHTSPRMELRIECQRLVREETPG